MSNINKQALRGQSVDANFYLAECCNCGQVMPSSKLIESQNYMDGDADCYCPQCNADDCDISDMGSAASEAWNYQQKRIEALLDELEAAQRYAKERDEENQGLMLTVGRLRVEKEAAEKRIDELERGSKVIKCWSCQKSVTVDQVTAEDGFCPSCNCGIDLEDYEIAELVAAGIITKVGE